MLVCFILIFFCIFVKCELVSIQLAGRQAQNVFAARNSSWLGADVATSIPIYDKNNKIQHYVWLFGDTLFGSFSSVTGKREVSAMPRNSIGIMKPNDQSKQIISDIKFDINLNVSHPKSIHTGLFSPKNGSNWLWPVSGVFYDQKLYLFAWEVFNIASGSPFALDFGFLGTRLISIGNPLDSPLAWRYEIDPIPFTNNDINICSATYVENDMLYLVGNVKNVGNTIQKMNLKDLKEKNFSNMKYFSKNNEWIGFKLPFQFNSILNPPAPETSLFFLEPIGKYMILNIPFPNAKLEILTSKNITGPYSIVAEYDIPSPFKDAKGVFFYAPKFHPELSLFGTTSTLFVTFLSNTVDIQTVLDDMNLYRPIALEIKVSL